MELNTTQKSTTTPTPTFNHQVNISINHLFDTRPSKEIPKVNTHLLKKTHYQKPRNYRRSDF